MDTELFAIQKRLAELGHSPGPVDGVWGPSTRAAISRALDIKSFVKPPAGTIVDAPWLDLARHQLGTRELPGNASSDTVQGYFQASMGHTYADSVPWCAAFVGAMLAGAGYRGTGSLMARSYLDWGVPLAKPMRGCVVVIKRGAAPAGHVGFVEGYTASTVQCLGGNQGDAVSVTDFARSVVLGFRWPNEVAA